MHISWFYRSIIVASKRHTHYDDVIMGAMASQITSLMIVYSTVYSGADQRKHKSSASLAFVWGIHREPVNFPHKWPVTRKTFPFDDVIMFSGLKWQHNQALVISHKLIGARFTRGLFSGHVLLMPDWRFMGIANLPCHGLMPNTISLWYSAIRPGWIEFDFCARRARQRRTVKTSWHNHYLYCVSRTWALARYQNSLYMGFLVWLCLSSLLLFYRWFHDINSFCKVSLALGLVERALAIQAILKLVYYDIVMVWQMSTSLDETFGFSKNY